MFPLKKILCPIDFSDPSYEALKVANESASYFSAELYLVHVIPPVHVVPAPPLYQQQLEESAENSLNEISKTRVSKNLQIRQIIEHGDPAAEIVRIAAEEKIDLLIIATHGQSGWRQFIFGSVADKVVRLAQCPVLTIRGPHE